LFNQSQKLKKNARLEIDFDQPRPNVFTRSEKFLISRYLKMQLELERFQPRTYMSERPMPKELTGLVIFLIILGLKDLCYQEYILSANIKRTYWTWSIFSQPRPKAAV